MKKIKVQEITRFLDRKTPSGAAESWDNVGLLVGDPNQEVKGAVVSVDLTQEALEEAIASDRRAVVIHHPCIFPKSGLGRIQASGFSNSLQSLIFRAIQERVAVLCSHTNFDRCALEVPEQVAKGLKATISGRLIERAKGVDQSTFIKLVTFVPETHLKAVQEAVFEAGAGQIGHYDECAFASAGEGGFRAGDQTRPFIGSSGKRETVAEARFETILPRGLEGRVIKALQKAHPYEEAAYDLYPVIQAADARKAGGFGLGYGFYGSFDEPVDALELKGRIKDTFRCDGALSTAPWPKTFKRVAFVAGKGASFLPAARAAGCDLFITGEAGYHIALDAHRSGVTVMELGHRESERFFGVVMGEWMEGLGLQTTVLQETNQQVIRF